MLPRAPLPSSRNNNNSNNPPTDTTTNTTPPQILLLAAPTGSLAALTALTETSYRRLSSLVSQLSNTLPQPAGLNPKAHRMPASATQTTARTAPGIEGASAGSVVVVDGCVLARWGELASGKKGEVAGRVGYAGGAEEVRGELEGVLGWSGLAYF